MSGTMYEYASQTVWDAYADHLSGHRDSVFGVVSGRALSAEAAHALENSARKLGYGDAPCFFCTLHAHAETKAISDANAGGSARASQEPSGGAASVLGPADLFEVIEGLDPIVMVAADWEAARALSEAYRCEVAPMKRSRLLGRTTVAFRSFEDMLATSRDKQAAWALLKQL